MKNNSKKTNLSTSRQNSKKKTVGASTKKTTSKTIVPKKTATSKSSTVKAKPTVTKPATEKPRKTEQYMLRKSGIDKQGNQQFTAIRVYERKPNGWKEDKGARTAPVGYKWINNCKSRFGGEFKQALLKEKERK